LKTTVDNNESLMSYYKNVLLIDDDADDHEIFLEAVKEIDSSVKCTSIFDGEKALEGLRNQTIERPDLIILDTNMPKLNGRQILVALKKFPALVHIPVVMYSTSFSDREVQELKELGAVHNLKKPARFDEFRNAISYILHEKW
jgi:CheY-like chemotaxis protein